MPSVTCYATPGKAKALRLCEAFAAGIRAAGGDGSLHVGPLPERLKPGAAAFYGVTDATVHLWRQARADGRDWYFIDNSYFDVARGTQFRITRNREQHRGIGNSTGERRRALGVQVRTWRKGEGDHAVICLQSDLHMKTVMQTDPAQWLRQALAEARERRLPARVRHWDANKARQLATLGEDLRGAALLITHSSAAAVEALLAGVPVSCDARCAAHGIAPGAREGWADVLADNQWTLAEMADGTAWRMLNHE